MRAATRKRRQRGTAMTEMLLGLPLMILMFAGVDYFRVGYAKRLETMSQSHGEAWAKAYSNDGSCFGSGNGPFPGFGDAMKNMPDGNGDGKPLSSDMHSSMFMYGIAHGPKTQSVTSARWSATVGSNTTITCNEVVPTADNDQDVLTPLADFIKSFIHM